MTSSEGSGTTSPLLDRAALRAHDIWGPGSRIPLLVISPFLRGDFVVDHTQYDTTSILATIERRFGLAPLTSRDGAVNDLSHVYDAKSPFDDPER